MTAENTPSTAAYSPTWVNERQTFDSGANRAFMPLTQTFQYIGTQAIDAITADVERLTDYTAGTYEPIATLKAELFNGRATFCYDSIVQNLFNNRKVALHDERLAVQLKLPFVKNEGAGFDDLNTADVLFINAPSAQGEAASLPINTFLTEYQTIKRYKGFPFTISFACEMQNKYAFLVDGLYNGLFPTDKGRHYTIEIAPERSVKFAGDERKVVVLPTPKHPLYVRYVNTRGGYDYIMLTSRYDTRAEITAETSVTPPILDHREYTHDVYLSRTATRTITASTGMLPIDEYDIASKIIFSPCIERFTDGGEWQPITLQKGATERRTTDAQGELTLTFTLPPLTLQK